MSATEALAPAVSPAIDRKALRVLRAACAQNRTLATAESCTGGLLASLLTDVPGCSHAFERGFVAYTDTAKIDLLGVPERMLEDEGAVSQPVAAAMARGALKASEADITLSVTGYCEATPDDPDSVAGLVHFACATREGGLRTHVEFYGDIGRAAVRLRCLETSLDLIAGALDLRA
ncbi:CinA family protein [Caulobacter sp. NIBR1757]|uniref:CinA family protein n=1 Tax=Caulobacter sp. NIBR1757 TaxID=3016000 RepID=UPI0022F03267|nr:CinA family protein [Caulobacter sp. NIBR1757]WGM39444.1 Nicotinamide-nucleotide amidohydrolase PncC [Caulobacter sp. NIBR1757]